ncbi:proline-rich protein 36-like [Tiliqua scincoides]|uniref:proline-rich protein 36-like n=1 Tax=Tiliqua scincoides TaxID=71010 RepID=UPI003462EFAF
MPDPPRGGRREGWSPDGLPPRMRPPSPAHTESIDGSGASLTARAGRPLYLRRGAEAGQSRGGGREEERGPPTSTTTSRPPPYQTGPDRQPTRRGARARVSSASQCVTRDGQRASANHNAASGTGPALHASRMRKGGRPPPPSAVKSPQPAIASRGTDRAPPPIATPPQKEASPSSRPYGKDRLLSPHCSTSSTPPRRWKSLGLLPLADSRRPPRYNGTACSRDDGCSRPSRAAKWCAPSRQTRPPPSNGMARAEFEGLCGRRTKKLSAGRVPGCKPHCAAGREGRPRMESKIGSGEQPMGKELGWREPSKCPQKR